MPGRGNVGIISWSKSHQIERDCFALETQLVSSGFWFVAVRLSNEKAEKVAGQWKWRLSLACSLKDLSTHRMSGTPDTH